MIHFYYLWERENREWDFLQSGFKAPREKVKLKCIQKIRELIEIQVSCLLRCLGHRHQLTSECRPVALPQGSLVHVCSGAGERGLENGALQKGHYPPLHGGPRPKGGEMYKPFPWSSCSQYREPDQAHSFIHPFIVHSSIQLLISLSFHSFR